MSEIITTTLHIKESLRDRVQAIATKEDRSLRSTYPILLEQAVEAYERKMKRSSE